MLSASEAQLLVLQQARPLPPQVVPVNAAALGLVLAEPIASDLDMPPYDKALMDGFAVRSADVADGRGILTITQQIHAGQTPQHELGPQQAASIMTGAPLPPGADAVVMKERCQILEGQRVEIACPPVQHGQNVLLQGREMRCGETVLSTGALLRPTEFGLLATVGRTEVLVHPAPRVAILSTGDEIVEAWQQPGPGQIRNSNGPTLLAQTYRAGGLPEYLGIARDRREHLRPLVDQGLQSPILLLSGGVSAGQRDLVPEILQACGVEAHFHKVEMKPGKPVFFGTRKDTLVFGLPGNPVSAIVCFELFVRPAIRRLAGHSDPGPRMIQAALVEDYTYKTDRPTYHPARLRADLAGWVVQPVPWFGSPDLKGLLQANAFVLFPAGEHCHRAGQRLAVLAPED